MLVLLPPSEGKADGGEGPALDLGALTLAEPLRGAREAVLGELVELCAGDAGKAREVLGLSARQAGEVAKNAQLREAPTRPAGEIYTGVLYDALGLATLSSTAKKRADQQLRVFSGLWGLVGVGDPIPSYRCSGGVKLPGLGGLGAYWRRELSDVLPEATGADELVLDLRSAAYAAMWKPTGAVADRTATVRVLQSKLVGGVEKRSVVSHFNKATKGRIVRSLLEAGAAPASPQQLVEALRTLGYTVEAEAPARAGKPWQLDVIVTEV